MRTMRKFAGVAALAAALLAAVTAQAATYYVDVNYDGANGAPEGTATQPWTTLYAAAVAYTNGSGHTIRVAIGEYKSTLEGGGEVFGQSGYEGGYNLEGKSGNWHGGYVGQVSGATFDWTEESRTLPDIDTIDPADVTVINLTNANSRAFFSSAYEHQTIFNGFVFRDSHVTQSGYDGGAMRIEGGMMASSVRNCVFINNRTTGNGGALRLRGRYGTSRDCVFLNNEAGGDGGGAHITGDNNYHDIENMTFIGNVAGGSGGGLFKPSHPMEIRTSQFVNNTANGAAGGGIGAGGWGTMVKRSRIIGNAAPNGIGGGVGGSVWDGISITLENSLVVSNSASAWAVAVNGGHNNATLHVRHTTIADNTGGGVRANVGNSSNHATLTVLNNIIANNGATGISYTDAGTLNVDYNVVWGHTTNYDGVTAGANDISAEPLFTNAAAGDYALQWRSPGVNDADDIGITIDLAGNPRPFNEKDPGIDMGAFETEPPPPGTLLIIR